MGKKKPLKTETRKKTGSKSPPRAAPRKAVTKKTAGSRPARPSKSAPSGTKAASKGKKASSAVDARSGKARKIGKMDGAAAIPAKASRAARSGGLDTGRSKDTARAARKGAAARPTSFRRITSSELGRIRTLLSEMKHRTESLVQREASELRTLEKRHRADLEEMASDTHETDSHCHIMDIENIKIAEIDAALVKIENGTYGVCEDCSQEIPFVRLEALPFATQCIDCKSRAERRGQISASASSSDSALS